MDLITAAVSGGGVSRILLFLVIGIVLCVVYWVSSYNGMINKRNRVLRSFSGIDIQLKKRWDLIPQLVETVKGYAKHEAEVLENLVIARSEAKKCDDCSNRRFVSEELIARETAGVFALAEGYPDLKADKQFIWLQRNLTEVEAQLAAARRSYNASVLSYNNALQVFPSSLIAKKHGFKSMDFFSVDQEERANVSV